MAGASLQGALENHPGAAIRKLATRGLSQGGQCSQGKMQPAGAR